MLWKVMLLATAPTLFFFLVLQRQKMRTDGIERWAGGRLAQFRCTWRIACGLFVLLTVACGLVAVATERMHFPEEATVLSVVAAYHNGQAIYPADHSPVEYGLLYGPVTYLLYLPPMLAGAVRLWWYEVWSLAGLGCAFVLVCCALRPRYGWSVALGGTALLATSVARFSGNEWAIKADVWLLLFSALGFWAALRLRYWKAAMVICVAGAVLVDVKATLLLVALLPFVVLWQRDRAARLPVLIFTFLLPILALSVFAMPGISLSNYTRLLLEYKQHATIRSTLVANAQMTLMIWIPTFILVWSSMGLDSEVTVRWIRQRSVFIAILIAASAVATVTGAKQGGGPWHCLVLAIPCLLLDAELGRLIADRVAQGLSLKPMFLAVMLGVSFALFVTSLKLLAVGVKERLYDPPGETPISVRSVESDLLAISQRYSGSPMQMGYSDQAHFNLTNVRPLLYILGNPLFIDPETRNEQDAIGKSVPPEIIDALARCTIKVWVLPKGGIPFSMDSMYWMDPTTDRRGMQPLLYAENFRQSFLIHYQKVEQPSRYFDIWMCYNSGSS